MKQEDASGDNNADNGDENEYAEDADAFTAKFGKAQGFGLKFVVGHDLASAMIRRRHRVFKRKSVTSKIGESRCGEVDSRNEDSAAVSGENAPAGTARCAGRIFEADRKNKSDGSDGGP